MTSDRDQIVEECSSAVGGAERLLRYKNDFEGAPSGDWLDDVEVTGPFHYGVRPVDLGNGRRGVRFPTIEEEPGGRDYSMMSPQANCRGRFVEGPISVYAWTVHLPKIMDYAEKSYYWENRTLFMVTNHPVHEIFRVALHGGDRVQVFRLENDREHGHRGRMDQRSSAVGTVELADRLNPGDALELVVAVNTNTDQVCVAAGEEMGQVFDIGRPLAEGNIHILMGTGNSLLHDTDLRYFSAISNIEAWSSR